MAPIIPMVAYTLALSLLASCARSAAPASAAAAPVIDASPRRQVDWLPADASLVVYLDGKVLRASELYESFAPLLPAHDPPLREALDRLDSLRIAAVMRGTEPALVGLFQGDFDDAMNPSLLTQESAHRVQRDGRDVTVRDASGVTGFARPRASGSCVKSRSGRASRRPRRRALPGSETRPGRPLPRAAPCSTWRPR
jgi:hypothetical protein